MIRVARVVLVATIAACAAGLPAPPAPPRKTSMVLSLSTLELSNGLRVVIVQDPRATEVGVTMRYRAARPTIRPIARAPRTWSST